MYAIIIAILGIVGICVMEYKSYRIDHPSIRELERDKQRTATYLSEISHIREKYNKS